MTEHPPTTSEFPINEQSKAAIAELLQKLGTMRSTDIQGRATIISQAELATFFSTQETELIDSVYSIDPSKYGFRGPRLGIEPEPSELVRIAPQPFKEHGEPKMTHTQYVPPAALSAYTQLAEAIQKDTGHQLLVNSSYRSNPFQAITFLVYLKRNEFDLYKTASRVAIPGYSEHGTPSKLAFDFQTVDGLPSDENPQDFEDTIEYQWLCANANRFDFYLSYPKDNAHGVMFEPWHWRHIAY